MPTITQGTNTATGKVEFIEAAFAELRRQLGYGGQTQQARRRVAAA